MVNIPESRGFLLGVLYNMRDANDGWVPVSDVNFSGRAPITTEQIRTLCEELAGAGLVQFRPLSARDTFVVGSCKVTAHGVDVMEGRARSGISIQFQTVAKDWGGAKDHPLAGLDPLRIETWEKYGVDAIEADLLGKDGLTYVGGPPEVREQARRWVAHVRSRQLPAPAPGKPPEVFMLKPGAWGMSVDLKEFGRRVRDWWRGRS